MKRAIFWLSIGLILLVIMIINAESANAQERGTGFDTSFGEVVPPTYDSLNVDVKYKYYHFLGMVTWRKWFDEMRYEYPDGVYHNDDQGNLIYSFCEGGKCYSLMIEEMKSKFMIHEAVFS